MPELVTKYPELAIMELQSAGISCGGNAKPKILITCPKEKFCTLPAGEFCIYGIKEVPQMMQIHALDLFLFPSFALPMISLLVILFLIGLSIGLKYKK